MSRFNYTLGSELLTELRRVAGRSCVSNPKTALIYTLYIVNIYNYLDLYTSLILERNSIMYDKEKSYFLE